MWPWIMIGAGVLMIVGGLIARHRMLRDYRAQLAENAAIAESAENAEDAALPAAPDAPDVIVPASEERVEAVAPEPQPQPEAPEVTETSRSTPEPVVAPDPEPSVESVAEPTVEPAAEPAAEPVAEPTVEPAPEPVARPKPIIRITEPARSPLSPAPAPQPPARPTTQPTTQPATQPAFAALTPGAVPFPDRPASHRLTPPPMLRTRSSDIPLMDWLRYYSDGNAWSGVIQSISDRISGDPLLKPYFGSMDTSTLQRHVMATVMELTGEGLTVGTVRRMAEAHVQFVIRGGEPITEPVWDKLVTTSANALREHFVPEAAVAALDTTVAPLKAVIVTRSPR